MGALFEVPIMFIPTYYLTTYMAGGILLSAAITILFISNLLRLKINNNNRGAEVINFFKDAGLVLIILEILGELVVLIPLGILHIYMESILGFVIVLLADLSLLIMSAVGFYGIVKVNINLVTIYIYLKIIAGFLIILVFVVVTAYFRDIFVIVLILDVVLYVPIILYGLVFFVLLLNVMMMTRPADIKQTSDLRPSSPSV